MDYPKKPERQNLRWFLKHPTHHISTQIEAIQSRLRVDRFDRGNQSNAAFFERLKKIHKKTFIEFLQNDSSQSLNTSKDKLEIAKCFYEKLYSSAVIDETQQNQFL